MLSLCVFLLTTLYPVSTSRPGSRRCLEGGEDTAQRAGKVKSSSTPKDYLCCKEKRKSAHIFFKRPAFYKVPKKCRVTLTSDSTFLGISSVFGGSKACHPVILCSRGSDICIHVAGSLCYTAETNTTFKQLLLLFSCHVTSNCLQHHQL